MRRRLTISARHRRPSRQVPVEFGDESWFPVPIRKASGSFSRCNETLGVLPDAPSAIRLMQYGIRHSRNSSGLSLVTRHSSHKRAFTLVEIMVVLALLGLIVFALMAVFAGTQRAFKASLTQTDTLEGGRAVMDLIAADLQTMTPCNAGPTSFTLDTTNGPVNFYVAPKTFAFQASGPPSPLFQNLIGSSGSPPAQRTNVLEDLFILSKGNLNGISSWIATGYSVNTNLADGTPYPLYRFYMTTNVSSGTAGLIGLFNAFDSLQYTNNTVWSHLMDGVVNLTARTYDTNGVWMTNGYLNPLVTHVKFARFQPANFPIGVSTIETSATFYSNALPASVQIELGTIEDHVLAHAGGLTGAGQSNYLSGASAQTHLFRQRISIPNVDRTAYQ